MPWEHDSKRKRELPPDWAATRRRILKRDGGVCRQWLKDSDGNWFQCKAPANQVDHKKRGNDHSDANLQALCEEHHKRKTNRESREARAEIRNRLRRPVERHPGML